MIEHACKYCQFITNHKGNYDKHLTSIKHRNNVNKSVNVDISNNIVVKIENKIENKIDNLAKQNVEVLKQNVEVLKQNEELRKEIEKLKEVNNQNTNKIVKEARAIKKSILTILNTNFKDTPSIDYINESEFRKELEKEYKAKVTEKDDRLFMRIFGDYDNKKLIKTVSDLILKFVKKEDQKIQPVFNIDSARGNFATKIEDFWHNDKNGLQLKKYTLDVIIGYIVKVLEVFRQRLSNMHENNKVKRDVLVTDYLMKYQSVLFEVTAYLTNSNTHKRIMIHMCPELRIEQKLLDAITK